jgi:hypothetical protein
MRAELFLLCVSAPFGLHASEEFRVEVPGFSCTAGPNSVVLPKRYPQLRKLARLQSQKLGETKNWENYRATEVSLHFTGLTVGAITFLNNPERYNLSAVYITGAKWSISPFRIGQKAAPHFQRLGIASPTSTGTWRFSGESDSFVLKVQSGKIAEVLYDCYTG